ncbi:MAG: hypothetical protein ABIF01_02300 [Candidatus Micrarchaeota archaeon]
MRAQIASIDLLLSTIALSVLALTLITFIEAEIRNTESATADERRDAFSFAAVQELALTPGSPENWDIDSCERIGLSCAEGELCAEKISLLSSLYSSDYNGTKRLLGLGAYDVSILICAPYDYSSCDYNFSTQAREDDRAGSNHVSRAEALSTLGGKTVSVIIYAWE